MQVLASPLQVLDTHNQQSSQLPASPSTSGLMTTVRTPAPARKGPTPASVSSTQWEREGRRLKRLSASPGAPAAETPAETSENGQTRREPTSARALDFSKGWRLDTTVLTT